MKVYLVGGAVRDQLLGISPQERDWVVVGARPDDLLCQNYKQVGRDFPVFLHPKTNEEYALARTERKSAPGYYGFSCRYDESVTLEDDLARRDLTINALAMDTEGHIIDPYGGQDDLNKKILRHVSPAFVEDPVRVLRVARFAARLHHLGFTLANETRSLMYRMVKNKELEHLVAERVWKEWQRSLGEKNPGQFILTLRSCDALRVVLPELDALFGVPNPYKHHPEVDSGIHTLMVLEAATQLSTDPIIRFAALVHDLGKALTPMVKWPRHLGHEESGVPLVNSLCQRLRIPSEYRDLGVQSARYHLMIHRVLELKPSTIVSTLERVDAFRRPHLFEKLLLSCEADSKGRGVVVMYPQSQLWRAALAVCATVDVKEIVAQGHTGLQIKAVLHQERVKRVHLLKKSWDLNEKQS